VLQSFRVCRLHDFSPTLQSNRFEWAPRSSLHVVKADIKLHAIESDLGCLAIGDLQVESAALSPLVSEDDGLEACIAVPVRSTSIAKVGRDIVPAVASVLVGVLGDKDLKAWLLVGVSGRANFESSHCSVGRLVWKILIFGHS
jgi:hypothetical protein